MWTAGGSLKQIQARCTPASREPAPEASKVLELAHKLVPTATVIAVLVNATNPNTEAFVGNLQAAARILGVQLHILHASRERDFDTVFEAPTQRRSRR